MMNMNIEVSRLRSKIVDLFHDTDIGLARMKAMDSAITTALSRVVGDCARVAESGMVQVIKKPPYQTYLEAWEAMREATASSIRRLASGEGEKP